MKNRSTVKLLSFVLAFLAVIMILPLGALRVNAVNDEARAADQSTEERIWASDETETEEETELPSHIVDNGAKDANVTAPNVTKNGSAVDLRSATTIANGVYALKNIGNANCWMGVESSNVNPGYHMWQKLSTTSPTDSFDRSCLFKITKVAGADRYIIRSMLNNRLSFGFSGSQVITKEIPPNDQDVNIFDTFTITINSSTGYITISPYGSGNYVIAPNRGATSGAYLYKKTTVSAPNQIYWQPFQYTGAVKSSINIPIAPTNWNYGGKVGTEYTLKLITWTTEIGANTPYMTVHSDYSNRASYSWSSTNYTLTVIPLKEGPIGITSIIRRDGTTTAFRTFLSVYSIVPEIDGKTAYIQNCRTGRYIDLELVNYTPTDIVQEYSFSTGTQQQWTFEVAYGGFFYIKSLMSGMYIGVDPSSTASIKQYADKSDYTLWRFKRTTSGNYTIACKATESSGKVLSAPPNSTASGANLTMYTYVDSQDYCDEWKISASPFDVALIALPEEYDRSSYFGRILGSLAEIEYDESYDNHVIVAYMPKSQTGTTRSELLYYMKNSKITLIRTHGGKTSVSTGDGSLTVSYLSTLSSDYLSNSELIIYGACGTAMGGENDSGNLVNATVAKGARTVIGFEKSVYASACNEWCEVFFEYYTEYRFDDEKTIEDVCISTDNILQNHIDYCNSTGTTTLAEYLIAGQDTFPQN